MRKIRVQTQVINKICTINETISAQSYDFCPRLTKLDILDFTLSHMHVCQARKIGSEIGLHFIEDMASLTPSRP